MQVCFPSPSKIFRLGGEEFLVLLPGADCSNAARKAEELRKSLPELDLVKGRPVTASLGVAEFRRGENWNDWLKRSDAYLYRAKAEGRDRVVF